jgi:hypothetical protein
MSDPQDGLAPDPRPGADRPEAWDRLEAVKARRAALNGHTCLDLDWLPALDWLIDQAELALELGDLLPKKQLEIDRLRKVEELVVPVLRAERDEEAAEAARLREVVAQMIALVRKYGEDATLMANYAEDVLNRRVDGPQRKNAAPPPEGSGAALP